MVCVGGLDYGYLGFPYERDCYLGAPLESQTTNSKHQFTSSWICIYMYCIFIYLYTCEYNIHIHICSCPNSMNLNQLAVRVRSTDRCFFSTPKKKPRDVCSWGSRVFQGGFGTWRDMAKSVLLGQLWKENTQRLVDLCSYSRELCF